MNSDRIKEIQQLTAHPESSSVYRALLLVWHECEQEKSKAPHRSAKEILDEMYDADYRSNYKKDYPIHCILAAMEAYARQTSPSNPMQVIRLSDGAIIEACKLLRDGEGRICAWSHDWPGQHIIGDDCKFLNP
jgi:hypothetical protein